MNKKDFFKELLEALEFEGITLNENINLKEIEGYGSLSIMTIIAFVHENFQKKLTAQQLASISTVKSLMELIGIEQFED